MPADIHTARSHTHTHTCSETLKDTINRPALMWCCVVLALGYKALPERKRERWRGKGRKSMRRERTGLKMQPKKKN